MKKIFLLCLITGTRLLGMESQHKGLEIPGALRPSEDSHSPGEFNQLGIPHSLYLERLANQYAQKITTAALEHYHSTVARGFIPGSPQITQQLLHDHKLVKQQLTDNDKQKKSEPDVYFIEAS